MISLGISTPPGVNLSCVLWDQPVVQDPAVTVKALAALGVKQFGVQFWRNAVGSMASGTYANGTSLKAVVDLIHAAGGTAHGVAMVNGPSVAFAREPIDSPSAYLDWLMQAIGPVDWKAGDTIRPWNEVPAAWGAELDGLYTGLGNEFVGQCPSPLEVILPGPQSQTGEDFIASFGGLLSMQLPTKGHGLDVHVYGDQGPWSYVLRQLNAIKAVADDQGRRMFIGEFGWAVNSQPVAPWYAEVTQWATANAVTAIAHQAVNPGDGLAVLGHPDVIKALGFVPVVSSTI